MHVLCGKVDELKSQLECRDERLRELSAAQEIAKQEAERHTELVSTLRLRVAEYESRQSGLESAVSQGEQQIAAMQQQTGDAQCHVLRLEAQMRLQRILLL